MLNAGFIPAVIVDSHKLSLGSRVFDNIEAPEVRQRFQEVSDFIKTYSGEYDFDWLPFAVFAPAVRRNSNITRNYVPAMSRRPVSCAAIFTPSTTRCRTTA